MGFGVLRYFSRRLHFSQPNHNSLKMKVLQNILLLSLVLFAACRSTEGDDPNDTLPDYAKGVLVVNEGKFGGSGNLTWHDPATDRTLQNIFSNANAGAQLGSFPQSVTIHRGLMYICVTNADKVYVVEPSTMEFLDTLTGLVKPRYLHPIDDRFALVTQWGASGTDKIVAKVDLNTRKVVATITCGTGPDHMVQVADTVYVANSGGYDVDSTITLINAKTTQVIRTQPAGGKNPSKLAVATVNGRPKVLALCAGYYLDATPKGFLSDGITSIEVPPYGNDLCAPAGKDLLYFAVNGKIWRGTWGQTPNEWAGNSTYGLGIKADGSLIYASKVPDFTVDGSVEVYNESGALIKTFATGVAPGEIYVRD
jgi:DNA-binding beta-propeller fold protein YncE